MCGHIHAENMKLYAEDAAETDYPWMRWQYSANRGKEWEALSEHPRWSEHYEYRRKPRAIKIGNVEVPEPMRSLPKYKTRVYFPMLDCLDTVGERLWEDDPLDRRLLCRGMLHLTENAARLHANALIKLSQR